MTLSSSAPPRRRRAARPLAPAKGHLCQVYAYLLIGINPAHYEASFVESSLFLVLP